MSEYCEDPLTSNKSKKSSSPVFGCRKGYVLGKAFGSIWRKVYYTLIPWTLLWHINLQPASLIQFLSGIKPQHHICKENEKRIVWSNHLCKENEKRIMWNNRGRWRHSGPLVVHPYHDFEVDAHSSPPLWRLRGIAKHVDKTGFADTTIAQH